MRSSGSPCRRRPRVFDDRRQPGQYGSVRRLLLIAIGLSILLWTASARRDQTHGIATISGVESSAVSADPSTPVDSDLEWRAAHGALGPITESVWKSAPVHAALAAIRTPHIF